MIPKIQFVRPKDIAQTVALLAEHGSAARLLAGGTDVVPGIQQESARFSGIEILLDILNVEELQGIKLENDQLVVGAAVSLADFAANPLVREFFPVAAKAASWVGSLQIRNRATLTGNFVNNAPCADTVPPLLVYDAHIAVRNVQGERLVKLEEFLVNPYHTQLKADELVTRIILQLPKPNMRGDFYKLGRRRGVAISRISLALLADISQGRVQQMRIASGAVTPIGKRFRAIEAAAAGKKADAALFKELARQMGREIIEMSGLRWSTPYKLPVVQQSFYQLLESVCSNKEA